MDTNHLLEVSSEILDQLVSTLELGEHIILGSREEIPESSTGSVISLVGQHSRYQLAILGSDETCVHLARRLLQAGDDEAVDDEEVADAICEVANIYAGMLKGQINEEESGLNLGLPVFVKGRVDRPSSAAVLTVDLTISGHPLSVVLMKGDASAIDSIRAAE